MKEMIKDAMILLVITLLSGLILGTVYHITKEPIAAQNKKAQTEACQAVFEEAASFEEVDLTQLVAPETILAELGYGSISIERVLKAKDQADELMGYVVAVTSHEGYGGDITFYMGVTLNGTTNGISLLAISDTPGLGMKAEDVLVPQYKNKSVDAFSYTKTGSTSDSEIDAISGATITTSALTNGVNAGLSYLYSQGLVTMASQSGNGGA